MICFYNNLQIYNKDSYIQIPLILKINNTNIVNI